MDNTSIFDTVPGSVSDSGWTFDPTHSIVHRGILDYTRTVSFLAPLSAAELANVCQWLETHNCPGWTGVGVHHGYTKNLPPGTYTFSTTHDSSD